MSAWASCAETAKQSVGGSEHSQITEIYHVISGNGTLLTGGSIDNPKDRAPDVEAVKTLTGPSTEGTQILNGTSRKLGPGDVVILPPNSRTPSPQSLRPRSCTSSCASIRTRSCRLAM